MKKTVTFSPTPAAYFYSTTAISSATANNDEKLAAMKKSIGYLLKLATPGKILVDTRAYETLFFLKSLFNDDPHFLDENTKWRYFVRVNHKFAHLLVKLFAHLSDTCDEFEINDKVRLNRASLCADLDENGRKICILDYLIFILNRITDLQFRNDIMFNFNRKLVEVKLIDVLMSFFKRDRYLSKRSKWYESHDSLIGIMAAIRNLSECPYYDKKYWRRSEVESILTRFTSQSRFPHVHPKLTDEIVCNIHQASLTECLEALTRADDSARALLDSHICYHDFFFVKFLVGKSIFNEFALLIKHDSLRIFVKVLERFLESTTSEQVNTAQIFTIRSPADMPTCLASRRVTTCYNVLSIINELVFKSIELSLYFASIDLFQALARFISVEQLLTPTSSSNLSLNQKRLLTLAINNLYLLTRHYDELDIDLGPLELVEKLLVLVDLLRRQEQDDSTTTTTTTSSTREIILNSLYCIANLIEDRRLETLDPGEVEFAMSRLLDELEAIVDHIEWSELRKSNPKASQALTGNLIVLSRLAVNPNTRGLIFNKLPLIRRVVFSGNRLEKTCALKLLTQICFDDEIANEIWSNDLELKSYTRQLSLNAKHHRLRQCAQTLLWWLHNRLVGGEREREFVYLSHHHGKASRRMCTRLRVRLEKSGVRVLVSEQLNENSMEAIGKLIRESECVLVCACKKYRTDERNQAEASYALRMNKPIILIEMDGNFDPASGWMSEVTRQSYARVTCWSPNNDQNEGGRDMNELAQEVLARLSELPRRRVEAWSSREVAAWFDSSQAAARIHPSITRLYRVFDGFTLKQIDNMRKCTPEFYYQTLAKETNHELTTSDMAYFAQQLDSLFGSGGINRRYSTNSNANNNYNNNSFNNNNKPTNKN